MDEIHHCDQCNLNFPHSVALEEHYSTAFHLQHSHSAPSPSKQSVPNASKPSCPVCKKSFKRPQDLKKHRKAKGHDLAGIGSPVTPNAPPPLPSASASTSAQAQAQAQAPSEASSNSYCTTCAKQFSTATGLQQHQSSKKHKKRVQQAAGASAPAPAVAPDPAIVPTPAGTPLSQAGAPSTATAATTGLGPVEEFFASYAFPLDYNANYEAEFTRLCDVQGWSVGDSQLAEVTENFRAAQVKAFGSARVTKVARVRQKAVKDAIRDFFKRYNFAFNPKEHHRDEYDRLCQERKWSPKKKKKAEKLLRKAEVMDFEDLFGTDPNDPESWRKLCETAGIEPIPERLEMRRQAVLNLHINMVDMHDGRRRNVPVDIYPTEQELAAYTKKNKRYFSKCDAYEHGLLRYLLREIRRPYFGDVPGGVGSNRGVGEIRVDPRKGQQT